MRVRPADAGEGRYFVRVAPGTNASLYTVDAPAERSAAELGAVGAAARGDDAEERARLFLEYLKAQEEGAFEGLFGDFLKQETGDLGDRALAEGADGAPEAPAPRGGAAVAADLAGAEVRGGALLALSGRGGAAAALGPEALLAALEACGVDNARIEVEGGAEVPVVDGSALGWALEVQKAGLVEAPTADGRPAPRGAPEPLAAPLTVRDGEAFISLYPGPAPRVTAGVHAPAAAVVGSPWFSFGVDEGRAAPDLHFRWQLAPARQVLPSVAAARELLARGLLRAGPERCVCVADGAGWLDPGLVRFPGDEAARADAAALLGTLALLAPPGGRGFPAGHVVSYRATAELRLKFADALAEARAEGGEGGAASGSDY